jgi:hypothetical protein
VKVWRNQSGNSFGGEEPIGVFPDASALSTVDMVDMLGTGTMCLVWSTSLQGMPPRVRYVDLLGSVKPHLLTKVVNNLGLETAIQYASSTKFYLEDRAAGIRWATRLPFPVQVVERLEHYDHVSKLRFVSSYRYRHGRRRRLRRADQLRHVQVDPGATQHVYFVYDASGQRVRKVYEHSGYRDERIYLGGLEIWRRTVVATETWADPIDRVRRSGWRSRRPGGHWQCPTRRGGHDLQRACDLCGFTSGARVRPAQSACERDPRTRARRV